MTTRLLGVNSRRPSRAVARSSPSRSMPSGRDRQCASTSPRPRSRYWTHSQSEAISRPLGRPRDCATHWRGGNDCIRRRRVRSLGTLRSRNQPVGELIVSGGGYRPVHQPAATPKTTGHRLTTVGGRALSTLRGCRRWRSCCSNIDAAEVTPVRAATYDHHHEHKAWHRNWRGRPRDLGWPVQ